jgi:hypothetical protein
MAELELSGKLGANIADQYTKHLLRELFVTSKYPESVGIQARNLAALGTIPKEVAKVITNFLEVTGNMGEKHSIDAKGLWD